MAMFSISLAIGARYYCTLILKLDTELIRCQQEAPGMYRFLTEQEKQLTEMLIIPCLFCSIDKWIIIQELTRIKN